MTWRDRAEAGRVLARELTARVAGPCVVLGIPRGGVPVAREVALALNAPLDVVLVRKLPLPNSPETACGVVGEDGATILNEEVIRLVGVSAEELSEATLRARAALERYARRFRGERPAPDLQGRTVILVDDGLATGYTMLGAVALVRGRGAARVVVAVPVAASEAAATLRRECDLFVCPLVDPAFYAVGAYYRDFHQLDDEETARLLEPS